MCGLFGLVRNPGAKNPEWATAVIAELGEKATTRGRQGSGVAYIPVDANSSTTPAQKMHAEARFTQVGGGIVINKDAKEFADVWNDERDVSLAQSAAAIIGHTRTATQGDASDRKNVSPLAVGTVIATHNGDIDESTVQEWLPKDSKNYGATDTETLFRAINHVRSHRKKITDILSATHGRVGIAWYDRRLPGRMYIARGGMAPVAIGFDSEDNLYWASNPQWFRDIDKMFDGAIGFHSIMMVPEGRLITIRYSKTAAPTIDDLREFVPTVRRTDTYLPDRILWRDFTDADQKADKASFIHKVYERSWTGSTVKTDTRKNITPSSVRKPSEYEWDTPVVDRYGHIGSRLDSEYASVAERDEFDIYADVDSAYGIDWLDEDATSSQLLESISALEECTDEEGAEAVSEATMYIESERQGQVGGSYVRQALYTAVQEDNYEGVVRDFGFTSEIVARAFAELVLAQAP